MICFGQGQGYVETGSLALHALNLDGAALLTNDAPGHIQPQAGAVAHIFGGVKRVEDAFHDFGRNPRAGVADLDESSALFGQGPNGDGPGAVSYGLPCIDEQVDKDLLHTLVVHKRSQVFGNFAIDSNAGRQLACCELDGHVHGGQKRAGGDVQLSRSAEVEQPPDDISGAHGFGVDVVQRPVGEIRGGRVFVQVLSQDAAGGGDVVQWVVQLVGDA